jgi:hypothetical protein
VAGGLRATGGVRPVRLAAAMGIARRNPARVIAGDVIDVLPGVLASIPQNCASIVKGAQSARAKRPE